MHNNGVMTMRKFNPEEIVFADAIENQVSPALAHYVRRQIDAGHSLADVKKQIRAAAELAGRK